MTSPHPDVSEAIADAVLAIDGVVSLHGGMFGEAATYLPGRRVAGVRIGDNGTEVHVALAFGMPVRDTAETIRGVVAKLAPGPVDVIVEDVISGSAPP